MIRYPSLHTTLCRLRMPSAKLLMTGNGVRRRGAVASAPAAETRKALPSHAVSATPVAALQVQRSDRSSACSATQ